MIVFIYTFIWLILHIEARSESFGKFWLIFLTNLGYTLLTITMGSLATLSVLYTIVHYKCRDRLTKYFPTRASSETNMYTQDNIPWYVKIVWCLYIVANSSAILIFIGYWGFIYKPCRQEDGSGMEPEPRMESESRMEPEMGSGSGMGMGSGESCSFLDVHTLQVHGVNIAIVLLDLVLSRIPYQLFHFPYTIAFTLLYILFSLIYWGAHGVNHEGMPYIYSTLNYGGSSSAYGFALVITLAPMVTFLMLFLAAWLRDFISTRVGCCFRDISIGGPSARSQDQVSDSDGDVIDTYHNGSSAAANGTNGIDTEMTKV